MTMIERVAQAIYETEPFEVSIRLAMPWADVHESQKVSFRIKARAAIEAMREPTDAMWDAGVSVYVPIFGEDGDYNAPVSEPSGIYRAMIDAALQEAAS